MIKLKSLLLATVLAMGATAAAKAETPADLNQASAEALRTLCATTPAAADLAQHASGILIFPSIVKAGLVFGGAYGEGEPLEGARRQGYYNSVTASWGLQAGAQSYGYIVFLMTPSAVRYVHQTQGLDIGVGPTIVVVDQGVAKDLSSSTLKNDAYAFIFSQQGLMAGVSIEGTKISRIHP